MREGETGQGRVWKVENRVRRYQGRKERREKKTAVERKLHHSNTATVSPPPEIVVFFFPPSQGQKSQCFFVFFCFIPPGVLAHPNPLICPLLTLARISLCFCKKKKKKKRKTSITNDR